MENLNKFLDSHKLINNQRYSPKFVSDISAAYENVKSFSPKFNFNVFEFEGKNYQDGLWRHRRRKKYFKSLFKKSSTLYYIFIQRHKNLSEILRIWALPVEDGIKVSSVHSNTPEEPAERQLSLKWDTASISSCGEVDDSNLNFPDSLTMKENERISLTSEFSRLSRSNESEDEWKTTASLTDGLLNCKKLLNHLDDTYKKAKKEFLWLLYSNRTSKKDFTMPKLSLWADYVTPHRLESSNLLQFSSPPNSHEIKSKGLQNSQPDHPSSLRNSEKYIFQLNGTCERPFNKDTFHSISLKQNNNNSAKLSQNGTSTLNECCDLFLTLPSEESLQLFNDILLHLQNTYEIVRKDVYSWFVSNDTQQNIGFNADCDAVFFTHEPSSVSNGDCLMTFKGRNSEAIDQMYHGSRSAHSTPLTSLHSDLETLKDSSMDGSESELDDSESSLDGSFKQYNTAESRESMASAESDDSDEIPRFSLPPYSRKTQNRSKFQLSNTMDFVDKELSKEWSWKCGEKEFTVRYAQRESRLNSEVHGSYEIPDDLLGFNAL